MSNDLITIDVKELVGDAFYSIPDFTDSEGNHIGGAYGAMYKLVSALKGGAKALSLSFDAESDKYDYSIPALKYQIELVQKSIAEAGLSESISNSDVSKLEEILNRLAPGQEGAKVAGFNLAITTTSDFNEVEDIFKKALEYGKADIERYIGFYLLTDTVKMEGSKKNPILGLSIAFDDNSAYYIPVSGFITEGYLGQKLALLSKECNLATFDCKECYRIFDPDCISDRTEGYLENYNQGKPHLFDILIGAYLNDPNKNDYQVEDISKEYLKIPFFKKSDVFGKESIVNADDMKVSDYAAKAAEVCFMSAPLIKKKLDKVGMLGLFLDIEMPLSYILYSMEKEGIIARADELKAYGDKLSIRIIELESSIYEAAGCEFNINSPKQLGEILFEKLGLPAEKRTKSGYSTAADVLEKLAIDHQIVKDILEYRGLAKLKSTYADGLIEYIEADNRIHTSFNQTITATGRISSTEPNLQNIPMRTELGRLIRKVFVPKDGYVFADADYSQIELRILAHMSADKELIDAYHEGKDIHGITASKVFHVPFEEVTPLQRRNAKAVNFGIVYGISSFGLSQDLSIPVSEAKEYMDKYFETYPGVKKYQEDVIADAKEKGYSVTMYGRRRPIPELKAGNFNLRQFGERVAMNAPIQGTAADIMKIAMINVFFALKKEALKSRLILQIHDELVIETAKDEEDKVTALLTREMERAADLSVPLEAECHTGTDWYEAK
ncbi:DNA polymerase I [Butyrivibrio proteoclasticus]|uniref:DNA polymerase I n=1 Tax=Butyrivibrio proteoclasticus TaxID=43305 RepID=UPI00047E75F4|nr:DNA polymerase I [Butyrivibrio proteoclasticus]